MPSSTARTHPPTDVRTRRTASRLAVSRGLLRATPLAFAIAALFATTHAYAQRGPSQGESARRAAARSGLTLHEWGVWRLDPTGARVTHLQDLARESPRFVYRVDGTSSVPLEHGAQPQPMPPQPRPQPPQPRPTAPRPDPQINPWGQVQPAPGRTVARKPVIFLRATNDVPLSLEVRFAGGDPWLHYPAAQVLRDGGEPGLRFVGRVAARGNTRLAPVPAGHFWEGLRRAGRSLFLAPDGSAERFLFYDGPVAFRPAFRARPGDTAPERLPDATETTVYRVIGNRFIRWSLPPQGTNPGAPLARSGEGDLRALRRLLERDARAQGLDAAETRALLDTWRDELFGRPGAAPPPPRLLYFIPRARYDAMLPLRVSPTPDEIVRVGLVIVPDVGPPRE
jgi:hypothetical protein